MNEIVYIILKFKLFLFWNILWLVVELFKFINSTPWEYKLDIPRATANMVLLGILTFTSYYLINFIEIYFYWSLVRDEQLDIVYSSMIAFFLFFWVPIVKEYKWSIISGIWKSIQWGFTKIIDSFIASYIERNNKK